MWKFCGSSCASGDPLATVFFTRMKQPRTFPPQLAAIHVQSQQLLGIPMANTETSSVDGDTKQLFGATGPRNRHWMCSYTCVKAFKLLAFKECKGGVGTKSKYRKKKAGNPLNNLFNWDGLICDLIYP